MCSESHHFARVVAREVRQDVADGIDEEASIRAALGCLEELIRIYLEEK